MNKKIFFLIILLMFIIQPKLTLADQYKFYEAEYIPGIYMNKYEYKTGTIYYQQARFFRNQKTDAEVYCIEPFNFFDEHSFYETTTTPRDISSEQIKKSDTSVKPGCHISKGELQEKCYGKRF